MNRHGRAGALCAWLARTRERSVLIARKRALSPSLRAAKPCDATRGVAIRTGRLAAAFPARRRSHTGCAGKSALRLVRTSRAPSPGPEGTWPKTCHYGVVRLDPGVARTLRQACRIGGFWDLNAIREDSRSGSPSHLLLLRGQGLAQYSHGSAKLLFNILACARDYTSSTWRALRSGRELASVRQFVATYSRPDLTWADLAWLCGCARLLIVLPTDDARQAVAAGMDGLIVSNHSDRQVDGAIVGLDALTEVCGAAPELALIFDAGVRAGADIMKAPALGADAVAMGRPYAYVLALPGGAGVAKWVAGTAADFELAIALANARSVGEVPAGRIASRPVAGRP